jgi:2-oxoglutarate ferredoxin oxidoreductase subunit beta
VESIKKGIQNRGFSLIHIIYPCPTNFGSRELGTRNPLKIYKWIESKAAPLGEEKEDTLWATGIYYDASNSRPEFSETIRKNIEKIRRSIAA